MGGKKRKIQIKKIEEKAVKSVTFTKRRDGLFRKAKTLCDLSSPSTQIAILATPFSKNSHVEFYSFGYPSEEEVLSSFLLNQSPTLPTNQQFENTKSKLGFWWEDQSFEISENVDDLKNAVDAVSTMLNKVKLRLDEAVKSTTTQSDQGLGFHQEEQVLLTNNNETNQGLGFHQEERVLVTNNSVNGTNQVSNFQGETSAPASNLLENEDDILQIDDFFTDFDIDFPL